MSFSKKFAQIFVSTFTILNVRVSPWEKILAQQTLSTGQTKFHRSLSLEGFYLCFFCIAIKYCQHIFEKKSDCTETRAHICREYHELYSWGKNCHVEKFQLSMYDIVGKLKICPHVEKFWENLPQFTRFYVEKNWTQKYICGEKMTNMRSAQGWLGMDSLYHLCPTILPWTKL